MKVKVIGKRIVRGRNPKTLKWRDGMVVHATYEDDSITEGVGVKSFWLNGDRYPDDYIELGKSYWIEENNGYISVCRREECNNEQ